MAAAGATITSISPDVLALVAALGTLAVMSRRPWTFAAPLGVAALLDVTALPWAVAAAAITWSAAAGFAPPRLDSEPQRQLLRSRRRGEPASVLVMVADRSTRPEVTALWTALRATDGFDVRSGKGRVELRAVLEDRGLDRGAFEQRMLGILEACDVHFGWASFPADGASLDVLVDAARADLESADAEARAELAGRAPAPEPVATAAPAWARSS